MISFFSRKNLKSALNECQKQSINMGLGQELSSGMYSMIINTSLFKDIDSRFKSKGLSQYGGLSWFCSQTVSQILEKLERGEKVEDSMFELAEKMATIALIIANSIHSLKLTKNDMDAIFNAGETANLWLAMTKSEKF